MDRGVRAITSCAPLLAAVVVLAHAAAAPAATIRVTTTTDVLQSGGQVCSLREAIDDVDGKALDGNCAPAGPISNTIVLGSGDYALTISGSGETNNATGDLNVFGTTTSLTIAGAGSGSTTIDAGGLADRVMTTGGPSVTLQDLAVVGGIAPAGADGGGIVANSPLTLNGVLITRNRAGDGAPSGGFANSGGDGGGISSGSTVTVQNSTITGNHAGSGGMGGAGGNGSAGGSGAAGGTGGRGGGIWDKFGSVTVIGSTITANFAGAGGPGGIGGFGTSGSGGTGGIGGSGGEGGGISAALVVTIDSTISDNAAGAGGTGGTGGGGTSGPGQGGAGGPGGVGGGVEDRGSPVGPGPISAMNTTFDDNQAGAGGPGGIGGSSGAVAGATGGAGGTGGNGGGVDSPGGTVTASTIAGNTAGAGGTGGTGGTGATGGSGGGGGFGGWGGGLSTSELSIANATFSANTNGAGGAGGTGGPGLAGAGGGGGHGSNGGLGAAILANASSTSALTNVTIAGSQVGAAGLGGSGGSGTGGSGGAGSPGIAGAIADIYNQGGTAVTLQNTVTTASDGSFPCAGGVTDGGHNLSADGCLPGPPGPVPKLGPLADNGGPTQTMALLPGSPAIDAVPASGANCPQTDQRGVPRPQGGACDIGAFEFAPPVVSTGNATNVTPTSATLNGTVTAFESDATVLFEIGATKTPIQHFGNFSPLPVAATVTGLHPGTTYHYLVLATNLDGTSVGTDRTFTTPVSPPPPAQKPGKARLHERINRKQHSVKFRFALSGVTGFQCALVKAKRRSRPKPHYSACRSPKTYKHLGKGNYQFFVRGMDLAGAGPAAIFRFSL